MISNKTTFFLLLTCTATYAIAQPMGNRQRGNGQIRQNAMSSHGPVLLASNDETQDTEEPLEETEESELSLESLDGVKGQIPQNNPLHEEPDESSWMSSPLLSVSPFGSLLLGKLVSDTNFGYGMQVYSRIGHFFQYFYPVINGGVYNVPGKHNYSVATFYFFQAGLEYPLYLNSLLHTSPFLLSGITGGKVASGSAFLFPNVDVGLHTVISLISNMGLSVFSGGSLFLDPAGAYWGVRAGIGFIVRI